MYKYDHFDQSIVDARVAEFRDQVNRRIAGEITEDQFKPLRLMNGLYLQLHAYMLRVAIPYGTLDSRQMRMLAHIARKYDRDYGHFTTRQNIQYNWIKLEECADLLEELATVEMHAIQTSGNCIRNISSDQYAGAAADEVADPRPWAELLRQWSTFHPEFSYLPRKFKIAVIASPEDRAAMRLHDIGLELVRQNGELGARVFVGGGMGRTPMIAPEINPFVKADDLLSYIEACLRVYNRYGRRDNIYKARIKILVHEIGADEYRRQVAEEFAHVKTLGIDPPLAELERISAFFAPPAFDAADVEPDRSDPDFAVWLDQNVKPHKQAGYAIVNISLKPIGGIPGDATSAQIDVMADLAEQYGFDELRVTHAQNIVLPHVAKRDLHAVWQALREAELADANLDLISDIIACPGLDYCSLANARSIPVAQKIATRFADMDRQRDLGELKLKISGCINACGHHHAGHIGILGVDRKGVENYQLTFGGSGAEDVSIGKIIGPGFDEDGVVDAVEKATEVYKTLREGDERFIDTYRRVGLEPFKEAIYG
ncbi:MAG: sulfite reductase [Sphingomonadales bacterium 35-56-22]|jgi:sulfite reductase (NADPH) hemoprotein beta-component|uniref:nitrite/sulfite reductase n=1 Tax=Sphingorhabdus sp. TaxID=1902408 RepID=UPI000BC8AC38|nr:nitrite/sulfite reductase [Sphingorhabdus sp.]OYY15371.1 MAG: sulfite reductase [Sphingomonadales bacterium 35-56-22]OYY97138.1 MAG: sulfite reductase [Sphingomonadales bacterium 28-56-43]OYZ60277.1 MAG: sulfite reductase [Sphingomonadales bacterium 24-56-14]OZA82869.1 MAG: sulfite reductase [Sphingomonadales bacterium 39-57-19]HQS13099.1 nitrite/sulfite reductase [Sphingorhabdus sp.]